MDASEQYIKMCDYEETQNDHKWNLGDYYWSPAMADMTKQFNTLNNDKGLSDYIFDEKWSLGIFFDGNLLCDSCNEEVSMYPFDKFSPASEMIWLPRQDQLQDMVLKNISFAEKISFLHCYLTRIKPDYINTMEQAWLSFLMAYNHNKEWDGEQWISKKQA